MVGRFSIALIEEAFWSPTWHTRDTDGIVQTSPALGLFVYRFWFLLQAFAAMHLACFNIHQATLIYFSLNSVGCFRLSFQPMTAKHERPLWSALSAGLPSPGQCRRFPLLARFRFINIHPAYLVCASQLLLRTGPPASLLVAPHGGRVRPPSCRK